MASSESKESLRILHLIDSGGLYGAEKMLLTLAANCQHLGHNVTVGTMVSPADEGDPLGQAANGYGLDCVQFVMRDGLRYSAIRQIFDYAREKTVDIIHTHGYRPNIMLSVVPRKRRPCPIITTLHGWTAVGAPGKLALYEAVERMLVHRLDGVVAVSNSMLARLPKSVVRDRVSVIENGIDFVGNERAEDWNRAAPLLLAIGRLSREKGFDLLLAAIHDLGEDFPDLRLIIAGEGPEEKRLRDLAAKLGVGERVHFPGYVSDTQPLYSDASVFVIPSRTEGLPFVLLEAMAAGVPIVATRVGQVSEVLQEGICGTLIDSENSRDLANAIRFVLSNEVRAREMAAAGIANVHSRYSALKMARRYLDFYRALKR